MGHVGNIMDPLPERCWMHSPRELCTEGSDVTSLRVKKSCVRVTKQLDLKHINSISLLLLTPPHPHTHQVLYQTISLDPHGTPAVAVLYVTRGSGHSNFPDCCCFLVNLLNGL